jgi:hypothetical protein
MSGLRYQDERLLVSTDWGKVMSEANPNMELVEQFRSQAGDGPIVMLNLIKYKSPDAWQRFRQEFPKITGPILAEVGATVELAGPVGAEFVTGDEWDSMAAVRYPNFDAFVAVLEHPDWSGAPRELREETIDRSRLVLVNPVQ